MGHRFAFKLLFPDCLYAGLHLILITGYLLRGFVEGRFFIGGIVNGYAGEIVDVFHHSKTLRAVNDALSVALGNDGAV